MAWLCAIFIFLSSKSWGYGMIDTERSLEIRPDLNDQPEGIGIKGKAPLGRLCVAERGKRELQAEGW